MKKLIFILATLVSTSAWACPDLTGNYLCGQDQLTVVTSEYNGTYIYEINGSQMPADNQWYSLPDTEQEKNTRIRLSCGSNQTLGEFAMFDYESEMFENNAKTGDLDLEMFLRIVGDNLQQDIVGNYKTGQGDYPISEVVTCTRQ